MRKASCLLLIFSLLLISPAWARTMSIGKHRANVYSGPSLKHTLVFQAPLGYPLRIEVQIGNWLRFRDWKGGVGWVPRQSVSKVKTVIVAKRNARVRSAPGFFHRITRKLDRGEIYWVLEKRDDWIRIGSYNGKSIGWIQEDQVFGD
jgi:SH3-like domain-containing protein